MLDHNGADNLRKGRISIPGARYFITLCERNRISKLAANEITKTLAQALRELHREKSIEFICATTMPDHFHVLYRLGHKLSLGRVQAKFKTLTKDALRLNGIQWQDNYFDHRLREHVPADRFARYIFLNPYAKGFTSCDNAWPHWLVNRKLKPEFTLHLRDGEFPHPEWLAKVDSAQTLIEADMQPPQLSEGSA